MPLRTPDITWITRDAKLIIAGRAAHGFTQGFMSVVLAVYLAKIGFSIGAIGVYFAVGFAGSAFFSIIAAVMSERIGRRRMMVGFAVLMFTSTLSLAVTELAAPLMIFAFLGALNGTPGAPSPTQPLEQAGLAGGVAPRRRTDLFATYRFVATVGAAVGSLTAALPPVFETLFGVSEITSFKIAFAMFVIVRVGTVVAFGMLSRDIEAEGSAKTWVNPLTLPSRKVIFTLSALFSFDNFAGALAIQSLMAYWFATKHGLEIESLAFVFTGTQVFQAISFWVSAKMANRIGLVYTMAFTQMPSALLLIGIMIAPSAWLAILFLQVRSLFNVMDVAPRDSYTMAIVGPEERVAFASMHMVGRSVLSTASPIIAATLWTAVSASAPFIASSIVKLTYDVALIVMFRKVRPPEEAARAAEHPSATNS
ncbi:MAG: hypothetical protein O3B65_04040 [Chloroflexi bacterium]|nr:hypothetical protein [Chloroflexota bacterium]